MSGARTQQEECASAKKLGALQLKTKVLWIFALPVFVLRPGGSFCGFLLCGSFGCSLDDQEFKVVGHGSSSVKNSRKQQRKFAFTRIAWRKRATVAEELQANHEG